jgi:hypothetical protein
VPVSRQGPPIEWQLAPVSRQGLPVEWKLVPVSWQGPPVEWKLVPARRHQRQGRRITGALRFHLARNQN